MESKVERKETYLGKYSLSGDFGCVVGVGALYHFKCSIVDTFGLNKLNRIPPLETIFGNLTPGFKAAHLKMSDLKGV